MVGVSNNRKQWIEGISECITFFYIDLQVDDKQPNDTVVVPSVIIGQIECIHIALDKEVMRILFCMENKCTSGDVFEGWLLNFRTP